MRDDPPATGTAPAVLHCAECGERIRPGRAPGTYTHVARVVAACDLDSDHRPRPEAAPAG